MNKWLMLVVLALLVLVSGVGLRNLTANQVASTGAPVPITPWMSASTGAPVPITPWTAASTGAPVPITPWTAASTGAPVPITPWSNR